MTFQITVDSGLSVIEAGNKLDRVCVAYGGTLHMYSHTLVKDGWIEGRLFVDSDARIKDLTVRGGLGCGKLFMSYRARVDKCDLAGKARAFIESGSRVGDLTVKEESVALIYSDVDHLTVNNSVVVTYGSVGKTDVGDGGIIIFRKKPADDTPPSNIILSRAMSDILNKLSEEYEKGC